MLVPWIVKKDEELVQFCCDIGNRQTIINKSGIKFNWILLNVNFVLVCDGIAA